MRVLFVISCLSYGGAEKNLLLVAEHLFNQGHKVAVCNFNERPATRQVCDGILCYNKQKEEIRKNKFSWIGVRRRQYNFLKEICKKEDPDVLISFLPMPNVITVLCGKRLRIPTIISERADPYQRLSKLDKIFNSLYNKATGAVFQTEGAKSFYSKKLQKRSAVIPNPITLSIPERVLKIKKEIAFVARFELKQKRQDVALKAMKLVAKKYPEYKLVFWGDGKDEEQIQELAKTLGVEENVVFAGVTDCVTKELAQSEIFLLTSDYEGIPNALLEAMSVALPCVATDCSPGGAKMLLENGEYGKLVPCGDEVAVANAIMEYIEDKLTAQKTGERAQKSLVRFEYAKIMRVWESYIENVVRKYKE